MGLPPEHAFRVDPRPDRSNLGANSLYRLQIPLYDREKAILLTGERKPKKAAKKSPRYFGTVPKDRPFYVRRGGQVVDCVKEFIPIVEEEPEADVQLNQPRSDLRKIETEDFFLKRTQEFNQILRHDPKDIQKWMDFVTFQDKMSEILYDKNENVTAAVLEKKLSILERAIESNPKDIKLMITRLELVSAIWEPDKLNEEWKRMVFLYANNVTVWLNYVTFVKSHLTYFNVNKVTKIYARCFGNYNNILSGHFMTNRGRRDTEEGNQTELDAIEIFNSYVGFLNETGFTERCIASWQALIEFNLFAPKSLQNSSALINDWIALFEPFWDSNCPRIGDNGAQGWSTVIQNKTLVSADNQCDFKREVGEREKDILSELKKSDPQDGQGEAWYKLEQLREKFFWLPDRSFDDLEDSDRQVLFDDVKICLFRIKETKSIMILIQKLFQFFEGRVTSDWIDMDTFIDNMAASLLGVCPNEIIETIVINHIRLITKLINARDKESVKRHRALIKNYLKQESYQMNLEIWNCYINYEEKVGKRDDASRVYETAIKLCFKRVLIDDYVNFVRNYAHFVLGIKPLEEITDLNIDPKTIDTSVLIKTMASSLINENVESVTPTVLLKISRSHQKLIGDTQTPTNGSLINQTFIYALLTFLTSNDISKVDKIYRETINLKLPSQEKDLYHDLIQIHILNLKFNFGSCRQLRKVLDEALSKYPLDTGFLSLLTTIDSNSTGNSSARLFFSRPATSGASQHEQFWLNAIKLELNHLKLVKCSQAELITGELIVVFG